MAYCKSCGAYIPDGLTACLACGYDDAVGQAAARQQPAGKAAQKSDVREVMERHRKLQQEKNKQWAEQEKARRNQQEENRRWAQEEYAKRQAQREVEAEQRNRDEERRRDEESRRAAEAGGTAKAIGDTTLAALSYLSVFFALPFLLTPQDEYAKYHAKQGLRLFILSAIIDMIGSAFPFGWVLALFRLYCIYKGMTNAISGKKEPLPYIGTIGKF